MDKPESDRIAAIRAEFEQWGESCGFGGDWLARSDQFEQGDRLSYCEGRTRDAYSGWVAAHTSSEMSKDALRYRYWKAAYHQDNEDIDAAIDTAIKEQSNGR